ncbi:GpE family phage tail protein [Serratia proteamaculans]|nr:GpE family phage tail protein [Serratia proteamaculans]
MSVDDLMADIATIFHWPPSELYPMTPQELLNWRDKALQRSGQTNE